jgi:uroporphyrinogen decarboxylase
MKSRDRFELAIQHRTPDRVPLDIGATSLTGMRPSVQRRLREILGFTGKPIPANNGIDERVLQWAGTDFRSVGAIIDLPNLRRDAENSPSVDCWGVRRELISGEYQITHYPLRGATLEDLRAYPWPEPHVDDALLDRWESQAKTLKQEDQYAVIAEHPVYGILELGCWMCGYDDFLMRMVMDTDFVRRSSTAFSPFRWG